MEVYVNPLKEVSRQAREVLSVLFDPLPRWRMLRDLDPDDWDWDDEYEPWPYDLPSDEMHI